VRELRVAPRSPTMPAGVDSISSRSARAAARTLTVTQSPVCRSSIETTCGMPFVQRRYSVVEATPKFCTWL